MTILPFLLSLSEAIYMNNIWFLECLYLYGVYIDILEQQLTAAMTILSGLHEIYNNKHSNSRDEIDVGLKIFDNIQKWGPFHKNFFHFYI